MAISDEMKGEAKAFDDRIDERIRHGHIPDLRRVTPCDWFYNNTWRRPYLVDMDAGRAFAFALQHARPPRLLDIGCGPGHMALEFARHGYQVVGLDVSARSLEVAQRFLTENPYTQDFGSVRYVLEDFLSWEVPAGSFETVCFFGNLHHMEEPDQVLDKVKRLLTPGGRVLVEEPARDWITEKNAAATALIRWLLGLRGMWYEPRPLPESAQQLREYIRDCLDELQEGKDKGEADQSPHDNACGAQEMLVGLRARFREIECRRADGFIQRVVGGVRGSSEAEARRIAEFLDLFDQAAVQVGMIEPGKLFWAGEKV